MNDLNDNQKDLIVKVSLYLKEYLNQDEEVKGEDVLKRTNDFVAKMVDSGILSHEQDVELKNHLVDLILIIKDQ